MIRVIRALDCYSKFRDGMLVGEESPSWKLGEEISEALRKAIFPALRLRFGDAIHQGYRPVNVADAIHCAHCWLATETREDVRQAIKADIERLIKQLEEAAVCLKF